MSTPTSWPVSRILSDLSVLHLDENFTKSQGAAKLTHFPRAYFSNVSFALANIDSREPMDLLAHAGPMVARYRNSRWSASNVRRTPEAVLRQPRLVIPFVLWGCAIGVVGSSGFSSLSGLGSLFLFFFLFSTHLPAYLSMPIFIRLCHHSSICLWVVQSRLFYANTHRSLAFTFPINYARESQD